MPSALLPPSCQTFVHFPPAATTPGIAVIVRSRGVGCAAGWGPCWPSPAAALPRAPKTCAACSAVGMHVVAGSAAGACASACPKKNAGAKSHDKMTTTVFCLISPPTTHMLHRDDAWRYYIDRLTAFIA